MVTWKQQFSDNIKLDDLIDYVIAEGSTNLTGGDVT